MRKKHNAKLAVLSVLFLSLSLSHRAGAADYLAMNGAELYQRFCSSCHGAAGRGDGPVAASLAVEVPDLSLIARRQAGKFPTERIEKIVDGRIVIAAHGSRQMPIWGEEFMHVEQGNPDADRATALMVKRLVEHVHALQRPANATAPKNN